VGSTGRTADRAPGQHRAWSGWNPLRAAARERSAATTPTGSHRRQARTPTTTLCPANAPCLRYTRRRGPGQRRRVTLTAPLSSIDHTERRAHPSTRACRCVPRRMRSEQRFDGGTRGWLRAQALLLAAAAKHFAVGRHGAGTSERDSRAGRRGPDGCTSSTRVSSATLAPHWSGVRSWVCRHHEAGARRRRSARACIGTVGLVASGSCQPVLAVAGHNRPVAATGAIPGVSRGVY